MKIALIISTNGSVLSQLLKTDYMKMHSIEIISDRECGAVKVAQDAGLKTTILNAKSGDEFSSKLMDYLSAESYDLYISFYTRLFSKKLTDYLKGKLINLHPSILPACPGMDGFGDTVKSGSKFAGTTIHFVDEGSDTGAPIIQTAIPLDKNRDIKEIRHLVFIDQCRTLLQVIKWFEERRIILNASNEAVIANAVYTEGICSPAIEFVEALNCCLPKKKENGKENKNNSSAKANILDLRGRGNHPYSLQYSEIYQFALVEGEIKNGRSQPGFILSENTPFVSAAKKGIEHGLEKEGVVEAIQSVFEEYYRIVRPANASEWLGLNFENKNRLDDSPPWASVFPWRARSIESYREAYEKAAIAENKVTGSKLDINDGWLFCGPASERKARVEALRIEYVLKEISRNGYKRSDTSEGDVRGTALVNETGDWKWLITAGNHRAAAASALGFFSIPVRINLVINRQQAAYWPHVADGLYSIDEALKVFDDFFIGNRNPNIIKWLNSIT